MLSSNRSDVSFRVWGFSPPLNSRCSIPPTPLPHPINLPACPLQTLFPSLTLAVSLPSRLPHSVNGPKVGPGVTPPPLRHSHVVVPPLTKPDSQDEESLRRICLMQSGGEGYFNCPACNLLNSPHFLFLSLSVDRKRRRIAP